MSKKLKKSTSELRGKKDLAYLSSIQYTGPKGLVLQKAVELTAGETVEQRLNVLEAPAKRLLKDAGLPDHTGNILLYPDEEGNLTLWKPIPRRKKMPPHYASSNVLGLVKEMRKCAKEEEKRYFLILGLAAEIVENVHMAKQFYANANIDAVVWHALNAQAAYDRLFFKEKLEFDTYSGRKSREGGNKGREARSNSERDQKILQHAEKVREKLPKKQRAKQNIAKYVEADTDFWESEALEPLSCERIRKII